MATKPPIAKSALADYGRQAGEELRKLLTTGEGNRDTFVKVFTIKNYKDKDGQFMHSLGLALGETKQRFKDIFYSTICAIEKQFESKGPGFVWDETARIVALAKTIPLRELLASPGEEISAHGEDDLAKNFTQGTPNPAIALQTLGLIGVNNREIGGEYSKTTDDGDIEKKRFTTVRNIYASLVGLRYKAGIFGGDEGFRAYFEIESDKKRFKDYYAKARKKGNLPELITDMEKYLNYYARKGSKSAEFIKALEEAEKEAKIKLIDNADVRYPLGKPDEVLDKTIGIAMAIYFMVNEGTWERGKGAFLKTLAMEIAQENKVGEINAKFKSKSKLSSTPVLSTNELITPNFEAPKIAKPLVAEEGKLVPADKTIYDLYVKNWLKRKLSGEKLENEAYNFELYDLVGLVRYVSTAKRNKANISDGWLEGELNQGNLKDFMDKKLPFLYHQPVNKLLNGIDIFNAVDQIVPENAIDSGTDTGDRINAERVKSVELLLKSLPGSHSEFADIGDKLKAIDINGAYSDKEVEAVKAIQDFLFREAASGPFYDALQFAGIAREDIEQDGRCTKTTLKALAIWLSVNRGSWGREMKNLQAVPKDFEPF